MFLAGVVVGLLMRDDFLQQKIIEKLIAKASFQKRLDNKG